MTTTASPHASKVSVLSLATFHMANPGRDQFNIAVDDMLSPHRQAEITEVVDRLESFEPTKVAIEERASDALEARYRAYIDRAATPRRNETDQIGFRVARARGHDTIYGVDVDATFYVPEIDELREGDHAPIWAGIQRSGEEYVRDCERWLAEGTVGEVLHRLNAPDERRRALEPYLNGYLAMSTERNDAGPRMVANWYARNVRILGNVRRIVVPGDRVLLIFGSGHAPVFDQLLDAMADIELVDPLRFLPAPTARLR